MRLLLLLMILSTKVISQNVLVTAHRGASGYAPENTLSSVKKALEIGVDRIEVDVQQTSDGVVVCLHDKTLDRTTNADGQVGNKPWEEVKNMKAYGKFESEFPNEPIPTLEQVFELMDGKTQFVIEIKAGNKTYPGIEENVVKLIKKYKAEKWALVHSFNDSVLRHIHKNHPEIRLQKLFVSYSAGVMLDFKLHSVKLSKYDYVEGFGISKGAAKEKLIKKIHDLGKVVHVWTVNSEEDIQHMLDLGVDGIISNYPDRVKRLLGRN
ncbi:MAG: glycerophosphodiester phosphodiesterase [Flavobacteriales bacterium]|nr:glycerophosphodiester phosphodiesterase [Flavobacteriales bacterium]